jgi:hypothetical protein
MTGSKLAVTERAASIVTLHVAELPEQSPDQPAKEEPGDAVALRVTGVPSAKSWLQLESQSIPAGLEETLPLPDPASVTAKVCATGSKLAVTWRAASIVTLQVLELPEQSPDQPLKAEPGAAVAVRVTSVPSAKPAEQSEPQSIPAGLEETEPLPAPASVT